MRLIPKILLGPLLSLMITATALAASPSQPGGPATTNPGVRIGEWVSANVAALFAPLLGAMALYYLMRRQFTQFLSFAVFAVLASLFIFAGGEFKDAAVSLARWVVGN